MATKKSIYKCEQCKDTGWAKVKKANGSYEMVLCYCHPLVVNGKLRPLSGDYELSKYLKQQRQRMKKRG